MLSLAAAAGPIHTNPSNSRRRRPVAELLLQTARQGLKLLQGQRAQFLLLTDGHAEDALKLGWFRSCLRSCLSSRKAPSSSHFRSRIAFSRASYIALSSLICAILASVSVACRMAGCGNNSSSAAGSYSWACRSQYSQQSNSWPINVPTLCGLSQLQDLLSEVPQGHDPCSASSKRRWTLVESCSENAVHEADRVYRMEFRLFPISFHEWPA